MGIMHLPAAADRVMARIYPEYGKFAKFFSVGVAATLVDWCVCIILAGMFGFYYIYARTMSYSMGTVVNYTLNRRFTFENTYKKVHYQLMSFVAVAVAGLALNIAIMYGLVEYVFACHLYVFQFDSLSINASQSVSMVMATLVVFVFNFFMNKNLTFKIFK